MKILRPISISLAAAVLTAVTVYIVSYLIYPVSGVRVEGVRMFPQTEVWQAIPNRASLLTLNANILEERLKSNPWVKSVDVSKDWASGIVTVEVEERRPVLGGEMDGRRVVYAADGTEIPRLGGVGLKSVTLDERRLEEILEVGKTLEDNGITVDSIVGVGAYGVEALVDGRRVLFAEDVGTPQVRALPEIMARHPEVSRFDLRSPERIVLEDQTSGESSG